jgi:hypothetical protein
MVSISLADRTEGMGVQYPLELILKKKERLEKRSLH